MEGRGGPASRPDHISSHLQLVSSSMAGSELAESNTVKQPCVDWFSVYILFVVG